MRKLKLIGIAILCITALAGCASSFTFDFKDQVQNTNFDHSLSAIKYDGNLDGLESIHKYSISGSAFELGYQTGLIAKQTVIKPKRRTPENQDLNQRIEQMYKNLYPQHLEKIAGIAEAFDMSAEEIDLVHMERDFFINLGWLGLDYEIRKDKAFRGFGSNCSIISYNLATKNSQKQIVGRNFGWLQPNGYFVRTNLEGVYKSIGMTIIGLNHWIMDGINEKGLFIGVMTVADSIGGYFTNKPYPNRPVIDAHHMMRIVLDTCTDVPEAIVFLDQIELWFGDHVVHFLIADEKGNSVIIEQNEDGEMQYIYSKTHYQISTNTAQYTDKLASFTCPRYSMADYLLRTKDVESMEDLLQVMKTINQNKDNPLIELVFPGYFQYKMMDWMQEYWISMYDLKEKKLVLYLLENGFSSPYEFGFK